MRQLFPLNISAGMAELFPPLVSEREKKKWPAALRLQPVTSPRTQQPTRAGMSSAPLMIPVTSATVRTAGLPVDRQAREQTH